MNFQNQNTSPQPLPYFQYPKAVPSREPQNVSPTVNVFQPNSNDSNQNEFYSHNHFDFSNSVFSDKRIRNDFVAKVYSILTVQLVFTAIVIAVFVLQAEVRQFARSQAGIFLYVIAILVYFISTFVLVLVEEVRRKHPTNLILLTVLTISLSVIAAIASCKYQTEVVLLAAAATAVTFLILSLVAMTTNLDFTKMGKTLCYLCLIQLFVGTAMMIILSLLNYHKIGVLITSCFGAFIMSLYMLYDTQRILGGRATEMSPEDYVLGALELYLDIVLLFLDLLRIIGFISED